jgi:hypothetical protein
MLNCLINIIPTHHNDEQQQNGRTSSSQWSTKIANGSSSSGLVQFLRITTLSLPFIDDDRFDRCPRKKG